MIYCAPGIQDAIDQADIIEGCPLLSVKAFDLDGVQPPQINIAISRVVVLTQTCDLVNQKVTWVSAAPYSTPKTSSSRVYSRGTTSADRSAPGESSAGTSYPRAQAMACRR